MENGKRGRIAIAGRLAIASVIGIVVVGCGGSTTPEAPPAAPAVTAPTPSTASSTPPPASASASAPANDTPLPPVSEKQARCDALVDDANSALDAERIAVDKQCTSDAECVPVKGRACAFFCVTGSIPKAEEKEWNATVQKVTDNQCKKWNESACAKERTRPPPTCQDKRPWCDNGHCAMRDK